MAPEEPVLRSRANIDTLFLNLTFPRTTFYVEANDEGLKSDYTYALHPQTHKNREAWLPLKLQLRAATGQFG